MVSLAIGLGLNVAVFSLLNGLLLKPLPGVRSMQGLTVIHARTIEDPRPLPLSYPDFVDYRQRSTSFTELAAYQTFGVTLAGETQVQKALAQMVTADYFRLLELRPAYGRFFRPEETALPGGRPVAVISYGLWRRRYSGAPDVLGRPLRMDGQTFTVVGVMAQRFRGLHALATVDVWIPLATYRSIFPLRDLVEQRSGQVLEVLGRRRPGVSLEGAVSEMRGLAQALAREYPSADRDRTVVLEPLAEATLSTSFRRVSVAAASVLFGAVGILLLLTCANVGLLLWARVTAREREIAVRISLGANRYRLVRQLLVENGLLVLGAAALSFLVATGGRDLLWKLRPPYLHREALDSSFDARVLVFAVVLTLVVYVLSTVIPSFRVRGGALSTSLTTGPARGVPGGRRLPVGNVVITLQVTLCVLALAGAFFFLASFRSARRLDPGFDTARLLTASFALPSGDLDDSRARSFERQLVDRVSGLPGVERASLAENRLLGGFRLWREVHLPGSPADGMLIGSTVVDGPYFETTGIRILQGRAFRYGDRTGSPPVVIVNHTLAKRFWPGESALGKRFRLDEESGPVEVVGVAADSVYLRLGENPTPFLYLPLGQRPTSAATLHVRTAMPPERLTEAVRRQLHDLDPELPATVRPLAQALEDSLWLPRTAAGLVSLFSFLGLSLALIGLYGVTSHAARLRVREIGIRIALGASRPAILRIVALRTLVAVVLGLTSGLGLLVPVGRWLSRFLYGSSPPWAESMVGVAVLLLMTALSVSLLPVLRATSPGAASAQSLRQ